MKEIKDEKGLTLEEFLKIYKTKSYPKPYLTADCIIASKKENQLYILLIKRKNHPSINCYGIAGGFASSCETLLECARRELKEETGAVDFDIKPVCVYSVKGKTKVDEIIEKESFGMLFIADIFSFEEIHSEIEKIIICDELVENWTYPLIQPKLIEEATKRGYL